MGKLIENKGKGVFMKRTWEELQKGGSLAPTFSEIEDLLREDQTKVLRREEVQDIILQYFKSKLQQVVDDDTGEIVTIWRSAPTKTELAAVLGVDPVTLSRYVAGKYNGRLYVDGGKAGRVSPEDFDLVRKAYQIISNYYESKLHENRNVAGVIYWLNNSLNPHWSNEQTVTVKTEDNNQSIPQQSREEIAARHASYIGAEEPEKPDLD